MSSDVWLFVIIEHFLSKYGHDSTLWDMVMINMSWAIF
jgi:hypothetical protein